MWPFKKKQPPTPWYDDHSYRSRLLPKDKFVVVYWHATDDMDGIVTIDTAKNTVLVSVNKGTYLNRELNKTTVFEV